MRAPAGTRLHVIVPYYNVREEWLEECLGSVAAVARSTPSVEVDVIVVDDASPVPLPPLERLAPGWPANARLRVERHERNAGLGPARNTGLKSARNAPVAGDGGGGAYVVFLDGDDLLVSLPPWPWGDAVIGKSVFFMGEATSQPDIESSPAPTVGLAARAVRNTLLFENPLPVSSLVVALDRIGELRFAHQVCEDWLFWSRFFARTRDNVRTWEGTVTAIRRPSQSMSSDVAKVYGGRADVFSALLRTPGALEPWMAPIASLQVALGRRLSVSDREQPAASMAGTLAVSTVCAARAIILGVVRPKSVVLWLGLATLALVAPRRARAVLDARFRSRRAPSGAPSTPVREHT